MTRISSVSSAMEAYYKLTQSQLTGNEIKKELSQETQKQSSDTSTLDDVRDAIGIIKDEVQFLNKAKDTFNEIYDILDEAYNYLKNLNQKDMESDEVANLIYSVIESNCAYLTGQTIALDGGMSSW